MGMTQVFDDAGEVRPVTLVRVEPNVVIGTRVADGDGYDAVVLGAARKRRLTKPYAGGKPLDLSIFASRRFVDVRGVSLGKGFQGVIKRHGFRGGGASHGSKFHRTGGSTGQSAWPSRVLKGTRMAGRMGGRRATVQNLELLRIDEERRLLLIAGPVPGRRGGHVLVASAKKKRADGGKGGGV
ncbi:50S ribosomal protein L3 [Geodia barretti]|uniref:Large ribosomal subunit protein uL3c n=1 Tax=Geodia barretti TaxID=519541 RepID=A0AA35X3P4_GEOBA|nr:50S ribosomal protein L3 [Geodia barretti]